MSRKVAFVHYPHGTNAARLDTMPFALNSVIALAISGWEVDLFLWETPNINYLDLLPKNVNIKYHGMINNHFIGKVINKPIIRSQLLYFNLFFRNYNNYRCVFGLGQIGAYLAYVISTFSHCPFIYYNDEFPSIWGTGHWTRLESKVVKWATMIIVPDSQRFLPLSYEIDIQSKDYACLPNVPIKKKTEYIDWHKRLNIPHGHTPLLHAGSVADWSQIPEILSSIPYWSEKTCLIIHSRSTEGLLQYRRALSHLDIPGRVVWSLDPMSETTLNSLVKYCAANFALYRNENSNIEYIGFSSGKLMRSLVYGSPVIASNLSSFRFVKDYELGILVEHPVEIPNAVETILQSREIYSHNCSEFCQNQVSFEREWKNFCLQLRDISKLDLSSPQ